MAGSGYKQCFNGSALGSTAAENTGVLFRQATTDDLLEITDWIRSRRDCELWAGPYLPYPLDLDLLPRDIDLHSADSVVLFEGPHLMAFGQLLEKNDHSGHLARLIVNPEQRQRGYGSKLVMELLQRARHKGYRSVTLNVDKNNHPAQAMYAGLGFHHDRRPSGEYASPQSDYMLCELP